MREIAEAFLRDAGVSSVSLLSYRRDLEKLISHFSFHPEKARREDLEAYFAEQGKKLSSASLTRQVSVVRSFFSYLAEKKLVSENPMDGLCATRFVQKDHEVLNRKDFLRLIEYSVPGFRGIRDRAMLMLLCETGLRVTELVELDLEDVSEDGVFCGAGRRRRCVPISPKTRDALAKYLALRALYAPEEGERNPLFVTVRKARMTRQGFWKNLKERAFFSGVGKPISPHTLRRSLALHLMEEGKARAEITSLLGNADPASFRSYQISKKGDKNGSF